MEEAGLVQPVAQDRAITIVFPPSGKVHNRPPVHPPQCFLRQVTSLHRSVAQHKVLLAACCRCVWLRLRAREWYSVVTNAEIQ